MTPQITVNSDTRAVAVTVSPTMDYSNVITLFSELTDVDVAGVGSNGLLAYNSGTSKWEDKTPTQVTALLSEASTSAKGLAPQATAPSAGIVNYVGIANGETAYTNKALFNTSNAADIGSAAPGTAVIAARQDHVHAIPNGYVTNAMLAGSIDLTSKVTGDLPLSNLAPSSAASRLLGRGSASGAGDYQEISLGTGLSMSGTTLTGVAASTKTIAVFNSQDLTGGTATVTTVGTHAIVSFDDAEEDTAYFTGIIPEGISLVGGISVRIKWACTTTDTGAVVWTAALEAEGSTISSDSFDSDGTVTTTTNAVTGIEVTSAMTPASGALSAGERFRVLIKRMGNDGADTMSGAACVTAVELRYI